MAFRFTACFTYGITHDFQNNNRIQTSLNMGMYDVINDVPIDLTFEGSHNKNHEVSQLKNYLSQHKLENIILIMDRAYFTYDLMLFLEKHNIKYIIRMKKNSIMLNKKKNKNNKNYKKINELILSSRIVTFFTQTTKEIMNKQKKKSEINISIEYNLITNLTNNELYSDAQILNLYKSRWEVEIFFKLIKSNFKLIELKEKKEVQYKKLLYIELIMIIIIKILKYFKIKDKKEDNLINKKSKKIVKCVVNIN